MNLKGVLTGVRSITTSSGRSMVICKVGNNRCKMFDEVAQALLAHQHEYEDTEREVYGHLEPTRDGYSPEFVVQGFSEEPANGSSTLVAPQKPVQQLANDTRPEKAAVEVKDKYIVIHIPKAATPDRVNRLADRTREIFKDVELDFGNGIQELTSVHVQATHPKDGADQPDIPF